ncbi:conserved domain protein [Halanaerobium saccharolyticum subsp. saccharolyticum DSM 6643]|uniref:Conserved domain protein n=1 Tax=Halanaerobium saccharolyticum subsp. saccharolyticum DSM 6643 TaxID=1293054 RepID=M5E114_9FIRM|nr:energy transducer TonB [Halanaerobium saccharolyticum]CCU79288.1 conserved domain protein [Halanaerobium saccharolyticum subsp. saccharolyticum DSM 6643]
MKHNLIIYLTAFLLSLSLILLLEAGSLKLLAEDIKIQEREEVEIELLLSASNDLGVKEAQTGETEEIQTKSGPAPAETNEEADKNSSVEKKEEVKKEVKEEKEQLVEDEIVEDKIIEKKDPPKKIVKKTENKQEEPDKQQENTELIEETELEKETVKEEKIEVQNEPKEKTKVNDKKEKIKKEDANEPPAWMQNTNNKSKKDNPEEPKENNKRDKFDLDSFIADLEAEERIEKKSETANEIKEASATQADNSSTLSEIDKNQANNNADKNEQNNETGNSDGEKNPNKHENKVYDLRKGSSDSIKKPGIKNYSQPSYPSNLRKRNIEGQVIVTLRIDREGKIQDLKINESSGYDSFDQAALKAVSNWEFKAAEKDNKKIEVIVNLPIKFMLN